MTALTQLIESYLSIRHPLPRNAEAVIAAARAERAELVAAIERAQQDTNWMLNNRQFLAPGVFDYLEAVLAKHGE